MSDTARLLRAMATGSDYKERKHDIILIAAAAEIERLHDPDWIDDLREFLKDQEDADHNGVSYVPNMAMRLLMRLNELFPEDET